MFYTRFIELCAKAGKKPTPVVLELGLSKMSCSNWKKGHMPNDVTLKKIADYFGVSTEYLKGLQTSEQKENPSNPQTQTTGANEDIMKLYAMFSDAEKAELKKAALDILTRRMQL